MENLVKIKCHGCSVGVDKPKSEVNRSIRLGKNMFCSNSCGTKHQINRNGVVLRKLYESDPKKCKNCKKDISYKNRINVYCSKSCAAILNNKIKWEFLANKTKTCKICNSKFEHRRKSLFCSIECYHKECRNELESKILNGGHASGRAKKAFLIKINGEKCSICFWDKRNPITNKVPLDLDHIDGNHENNNLSNLRLMCPNCHSLTPTYKALNKGNGRASRRKRYADGKSF